MKKGFEFCLAKDDTAQIDLSGLQINLPPKYIDFINCYKTGENAFDKEYFLDPQINIKLPLVGISYFNQSISPEELSIDCFWSLDKVISFLENGGSKETEWKDFKLLKIGDFAYPNGVGIYLSLSKNTLDEIWLVDWSGENKRIKLENNIYSFVKRFKGKLISSYSSYESKLYKNWGEDFWRVKE